MRALVHGHAIAQVVRFVVVVGSVALAGVVIVLAHKIAHEEAPCVADGQDSPTLRAPPSPHKAPRKIFTLNRPTYLSGQQETSILSTHDGLIKTVNRQADPLLEQRTEVSIPQTIWQTARSHDNNPRFGTELYNTWTNEHPNWDHFFLDDDEVDKFVAAHYNETVLAAFRDMPLGVMRADVFRYMVIYLYGGVYADMDTHCHRPAAEWAPRGCHFAVGLETDTHFSQWAFAGVAGHGALQRVLELVLRRMQARVWEAYIAQDNWEFVHEVTGPSVFTEGILDYLGVPHASHDDVDLVALLAERGEKLREQGVCLLDHDTLGEMLGNEYSSWHLRLQGGSWSSWTRERAKLMQSAKEERDAVLAAAEAEAEIEREEDGGADGPGSGSRGEWDMPEGQPMMAAEEPAWAGQGPAAG